MAATNRQWLSAVCPWGATAHVGSGHHHINTTHGVKIQETPSVLLMLSQSCPRSHPSLAATHMPYNASPLRPSLPCFCSIQHALLCSAPACRCIPGCLGAAAGGAGRWGCCQQLPSVGRPQLPPGGGAAGWPRLCLPGCQQDRWAKLSHSTASSSSGPRCHMPLEYLELWNITLLNLCGGLNVNCN